jgi:two-component system cell cycle response regulator
MPDPGAILVVDDDPVSRTILVNTLRRQGHVVTDVEDGARAMASFLAEPFDLVLLDVLMPGMDGYEVLKRMKGNAQRKHVPVIMISGLDEMDSVVRCIELGADDYLPKPFDPMLLHARINSGLSKKRFHDLQLEYLEQVGRVVDAAGAVEKGKFEASSLESVAARRDALGQLARVFQRMAREVQLREEGMRREVQMLRIEIDKARADQSVAEITQTDYFLDLERKASDLRLTSDP